MSLTRFFDNFGKEFLLLMSTALVDNHYLIRCSYVEGNTLYNDCGEPILDVYNNNSIIKILSDTCLETLMDKTKVYKYKTKRIIHNKVNLVNVMGTLDSFIFIYYTNGKTVEIVYFDINIRTKRVSYETLKLIMKGVSNDVSLFNTIYSYFDVRIYPNTKVEKVIRYTYNITDVKLIQHMKDTIRDVIIPSYSNRVESDRVKELYNEVCMSY